jgi:hypothetical protein
MGIVIEAEERERKKGKESDTVSGGESRAEEKEKKR